MAKFIRSIFFFESYNEYQPIMNDVHDNSYKNKKKTIREMIIEIPNITQTEAYYLEKKMEMLFKENLYIIQE